MCMCATMHGTMSPFFFSIAAMYCSPMSWYLGHFTETFVAAAWLGTDSRPQLGSPAMKERPCSAQPGAENVVWAGTLHAQTFLTNLKGRESGGPNNAEAFVRFSLASDDDSAARRGLIEVKAVLITGGSGGWSSLCSDRDCRPSLWKAST